MIAIVLYQACTMWETILIIISLWNIQTVYLIITCYMNIICCIIIVTFKCDFDEVIIII